VITAWLEAIDADDELRTMNEALQRWTTSRVLAVLELVLVRTASRRPRDLTLFARMMDRHLWMLLGRLGRMTEREFDEEVRVTSDMIHCYLLGAP
jgi:hypothetical protein